MTQEKEDLLRLVVDTIPAMAWSTRPDGVADFLNQRWLDYTGLSLEQFLKEPTRPIHPEDIPRVVEQWEADAAARRPYECEMRLRRADGEYRWFLVRTVPLLDGQGNVVKWYGTSTDIEDQKRANEALQQSEFDLAEAQRVARVGSWTLDIENNIAHWSDELYRIFDADTTIQEGTYEIFLSRVHPDDRTRVLQADAEAKANGKPFEMEYRIRTRTGQLKYIRETGYARTNSEGIVCGLYGTALDITEHKLAENALRDSGIQLQALSRRLVKLQESERKELARELHDRVGQSLTALNINLSILAATLPSQATDELRARLADSEALIESTVAAIRDVAAELRPPMLDEGGLMPALEWYARQVSGRTGVPIAVNGPTPVERPAPEIEIVLFRIAQEALNNVAKHAQASRVEIAVERSGSGYVMSVKDDGIGFDAAEDREARHTGLGMVTMRERAQAVDGSFEVQTFPGGGTQLTVRVPG
jgi:PAS domain S-box-containing protein